MPPANTPSPERLLDTWGRRNRKNPDKVCPECGTAFRPRHKGSKYCSRPCVWANNGGASKKEEPIWWVNPRGYIEGRVWEADGTRRPVKQHRYIMEQELGRRLSPDEHVHHLDGDKQNNSLENLQVLKHGDHSKVTNFERWGNEDAARALLSSLKGGRDE